MSNLICKENFNWQKYVDRYKELKDINNLDTAWNHWCEEGRKQGRKFFTLEPFKNNKYYIITREYIKKKNIILKSNSNTVVSHLDDDIVIEDYISNIKHKLKKFNKNKIFVCQTINQTLDNKTNIKMNNKTNIKQENNNIEILDKDIKYTEYKIKKNQTKDEWTQKTENSEIFFLDYKNNKDDSDESKKYFSKKNPLNVFSNST